MSKVSKKSQSLGAYHTPPLTASFMAECLKPFNPKDTFWDPCVGKGALIKALLKQGANPANIYCNDIDHTVEEFIKELHPDINFKALDTLLLTDRYKLYDKIIANPPYLNKNSAYIKENREKLKKLYPLCACETFSMFLYLAINKLNPNGKLCFIISDSIRTLKQHIKIRQYILKHMKIINIIKTPPRLFKHAGISIKTCIITLQKPHKLFVENAEHEENLVETYECESEEDYFNPPKIIKIPQGLYLLTPRNAFVVGRDPSEIKKISHMPKLSDFCVGYIGIHTHNNKKYLIACEGTPCGEVYKRKNWSVLEKDEIQKLSVEPYLHTSIDSPFFRDIGQEFIIWSESSKDKYDIPKYFDKNIEGIGINGISGKIIAFYKPPNVMWDSNKVFLIRPQNKDDLWWLLGYLNSKIASFILKTYINSTNSIQLKDILELPIPNFSTSDKRELSNIARSIYKRMKTNNEPPLPEFLDKLNNIVKTVSGIDG